MAGDLGLDPVVVVSHSDRSVGCQVIVLAKRSEGTKATAVHLPLSRAKPCMRYLEAGPRLVGTSRNTWPATFRQDVRSITF
jgi:hypothetical protein